MSLVIFMEKKLYLIIFSYAITYVCSLNIQNTQNGSSENMYHFQKFKNMYDILRGVKIISYRINFLALIHSSILYFIVYIFYILQPLIFYTHRYT